MVNRRLPHYDQFGGVTNPKLAATWNVGHGLSLRGTWGKSFRAPEFGEASNTASVQLLPLNVGAGAPTNTVMLSCPGVAGLGAAGTANAGSLNAYLNATCSGAAALLSPAGVSVVGGAGGAASIRSGQVLGPEHAKNWAFGFDFKPTDFLSGLDIDATWYHLRIDNLIAANGVPPPAGGTTNPNDPLNKVCTDSSPGCVYLVRANPNLPITDPANAEFLALVNSVVLAPRSTVPPSNLTNIQFINDAAVTNLGWHEIDGIDFDARYDFDLGDWGAWNVGVTGNYELEDKTQAVLGSPSSDALAGNAGGRLKYRGRLGWAGTDGLSVTAFANYIPHSAVSATAPPACYWAAGFSAGSCYPGSPYFGPHTVFPNRYPGLFTFDLALAYQTGTRPANEYLQNLNFQLTVLDLFNKAPPFNYATASGRGLAAYVNAITPQQRYVTFAVTKAW